MGEEIYKLQTNTIWLSDGLIHIYLSLTLKVHFRILGIIGNPYQIYEILMYLLYKLPDPSQVHTEE